MQGQFGVTSEKPKHLPELDIQVSSFRSDVCLPSKSLVQMKAMIFNLGGDWDGCVVNVKGGQTFVRVVNRNEYQEHLLGVKAAGA